ncbi:hypothetical protein, partial [Nitrosovibrio sp. Nv4]
IRQFLRRNNIGVQGASYEMPGGMREVAQPTGELGKDGKPVFRRFLKTGTIKLQDNCARAMYKDMKRHGQVPA